MKEIKKSPFSWDNISIEKYYKIEDILNSSDEDLDKQVQLLSVITGKSEEYYYSLPINEAAQEIQNLVFLNRFELIPKYRPKKIKIVDREFYVMSDPSQMSYGAFIDYQAYIKKPLRDSMGYLLTLFVIPEGKKYNDGYDLVELEKFFRENMAFREAQSLLSFFLMTYLKSYQDSLKYLVKKMRKMKNQEEKEEILQKMRELNQRMKNLISIAGSVYSKESQI